MEEEIFNYQTLRYILDKNGYVCHASLGGFISCDLGECTEYTGATPNGYSTIEDWYEEELERLNAWKVVNGNLVFDPNRYETLQVKCEKEHEDNRYVCHKEISNLTNLVKADNADVYLTSETASSNLIEVTDSNKFASTYIELVPNQVITNKIHIKFNNGNLLTNDATSKNESGIYFVVNADKTIYISGIATNDIEYDIGGYSNNTKPILGFKKGINYYLSSNGYQIKMYHFDGTDRSEIYSGNGGVINFTDSDKIVTQIVLFIPNATNVNATISPMLNVGNTSKNYIPYDGNDAIVYLEENTLTKGDSIEIENGTPILQDSIYLSDIEMPNTYLDLTYMYCMENVNLKVKYPNTQRNNDLTGYETPNGGFAIDEEGNMYCNNATITGGTIDLTSPNNLPVIKVANSNGAYSSISGAEIGMVSSDNMRYLTLSNFEGQHPQLTLSDDFEEDGGQTIVSSTGITINGESISISKASKNLLDPFNKHSNSSTYDYSNNTYKITSSGAIYLLSKVEVGNTYTLSYKNNNGFASIRANDYNNGSWIEYGRSTTTNGTITFEANTNTVVIQFVGGTANSSTIQDVQLEQSSTATGYEEYYAPYIVAIDDNGGHHRVGENYSLGEQVIGTWIDGKPLYRKVVKSTKANIKTDCNSDNSSQTRRIIKVWGYAVSDNNSAIPSNSYEGSTSFVFTLWWGNGTGNVQCTMGSGFSDTNEVVVVMEYTKTTD